MDRCQADLADEGGDPDEIESECELLWNRWRGGEGKAMKQVIYKETHAGNSGGGEYILSTGDVDRMNDIVEPSGWLLDRFRSNPVALAFHDSRFPIGVWERVRIEDGALKGKLVLAPKNASPRISEIHSLISARVLRSTSVGFRALSSEPRKDGNGTRFTRQELIEVSIVATPANPACLEIARSLNLSPEVRAMVFANSGNRPVAANPVGDARRAAEEAFKRATAAVKRDCDRLAELLKTRRGQAYHQPPQGWGTAAVSERERAERSVVAALDLRDAKILDLAIDAQRSRVALAERKLANAYDALAALDGGARR
jgi:HK97 family phage prohead protease